MAELPKAEIGRDFSWCCHTATECRFCDIMNDKCWKFVPGKTQQAPSDTPILDERGMLKPQFRQ